VLLAVACHSHPHRPEPQLENHGSGAAQPSFEVTLTRTVCFGSCPAYTVTIHPDGSVDWRGTQYVAAVGVRHGRIAGDGFARLARAIEKVRFFELDANGHLPRPAACTHHGKTSTCDFPDIVVCSDTPTATVTITRSGAAHTTSNDHCQEAPLDLLEDEIDDVAQTKAWIGGTRPWP
jgi:hypothetical protein